MPVREQGEAAFVHVRLAVESSLGKFSIGETVGFIKSPAPATGPGASPAAAASESLFGSGRQREADTVTGSPSRAVALPSHPKVPR